MSTLVNLVLAVVLNFFSYGDIHHNDVIASSLEKTREIKNQVYKIEDLRSRYVITKEEKIKSDFRLVDQFRGAAISIMNNIAEGFDPSSNKEFVRFLFYSSRSCSEIISMSYILKEIYNLQTESDDLYSKTLSCRKQIKGFIKYLTQN